MIVLTLNVIVFYQTVTFIDFFADRAAFQNNLIIIGLMQWVWLLTGLTLAMKGYLRKEPIDLRYKLSTVGLIVILCFSIINWGLYVL